MHISLNWLKDFVDIPKNLDPKELGSMLTLKTAEVESVESEAHMYENMVTGLVISLNPHPNADKLKIAQTSIGKETVQIVCGGENLKEGMSVAVAKIGAKVKWHGEGDLVTMEKVKIRGEESHGMICASNEIGVDNPNEGPRDIMDLSSTKPEPGTPLSKLFEKDDTVFEFDNKSLTHRPDLWGHYGIAREVAAITGGEFKELMPDVKIPEKGESVDVKIEDYDLCPRYCGLIIENIKVEESPDWLKRRLKATGHGTHGNIVDITNYVMTELGQPMHAFDKSYIEGGIIVRTAKKGEKIKSLDGKTNTLSEDMLVIADHKKPVAIAGVIGGEHSGINEKTTSIILESANFSASNVRKTSTKLGIRTDSVQRFEKSLDPLLAELAIRRAAELILQICPGANIAGPITDEYDGGGVFTVPKNTIELNCNKVRSKTGVEVSNKQIKEILESLEFEVVEKKKDIFEVGVPSFRATKDISTEDDLIEEVARIYGYNNIPTTLPSLPTKLPEENTERFKKHRARELFSYGLGFNEVYNYSFYGQTELEKCLLQEDGHIKILNFLSEDQTHMRTTLVPNLLKNIQLNIKYADSSRLYEIGRIYKEIGNFMPLEEKCIAGAITIKGKAKDVFKDPFLESKGAIEAFLNKFNIKGVKEAAEITNTPYSHPKKAVSYIDFNGQTIAKAYTLHPAVQKAHGLEGHDIVFFEINFTEILKLAKGDLKYNKITKFPSITLDISVVVPEKTTAATIKSAIEKAQKELIAYIELFDIYKGENLEKGTKALAYKITLQAPDRTLTDEEMARTQQKIFNNLEQLGGTIRGK